MAEKLSGQNMTFGGILTAAGVEIFDQLTSTDSGDGKVKHVFDFSERVLDHMSLELALALVGAGIFEAVRQAYRSVRPRVAKEVLSRMTGGRS